MSSNKPEPEYLNRLNCVAKVKHTRKTATTAISASKSKGLSMYKCENCEFYHLTSRATEVGAKPTAGRKQDLSEASTPSQEDNNFEQELDDLIMRLKDCISHEHTNQFGDRCITKVQFKQEMKALYQSSLEEAVRKKEYEVNVEVKLRELTIDGFKTFHNTWRPDNLTPTNILTIPLDSKGRTYVRIELATLTKDQDKP